MKTVNTNSASRQFQITPELLRDNCILRNASSGPKSSKGDFTFDCLLCKTKRIKPALLEAHIVTPKHSETFLARQSESKKSRTHNSESGRQSEFKKNRTPNSESGYSTSHFEISPQLLKDNCITISEHSKKVNGTTDILYECRPCNVKRILSTMLHSHFENAKHYEFIQRRNFGLDEFIEKYHSNCVQYSLEFLLHDRSMDEEEFAQRSLIVTELEERLHTAGESIPELNGATVELYGSTVFHGALKTSDINCFLKVKEYLLAVGKVKDVLEQFEEYKDIQLQPSHRYPRIKIKHVETVDGKEKEHTILICVYSQKSENFSELMTVYGMCDVRFLQLARLLKIHCTDLNLVDGVILSNHLFFILAISFCQRVQPPILPTFDCSYDNLMSKSEEEYQKKWANTLKEAKVTSSCTDINMKLFTGNFVIGILRKSMFNLALECDMNISCDEIDECIKTYKVEQSLFPKITAQNNPWDEGSEKAIMPDVDTWNTDTSPSPQDETPSPQDETPSLQENPSSKDTVDPPVNPVKGWDGVEIFEDKDAKYTLTDWGNKFVSGVRQVCNQWEVQNKDPLHKLFQQMLRYLAKFCYDRHAICIRSSSKYEPLPDRSFLHVEDPFQPNAALFNPNFNAKNRKNRKTRNKLCNDIVKHIRDTFGLLRQYYEGAHQKKLCTSNSSDGERSAFRPLPPFSPFEMAIRFKIPPPLSEVCGDINVAKQEKLPPISQIPDAALEAVSKIILRILDKHSMSEKDYAEREKTFQELTHLVQTKVKANAKPMWFGSSKNGLVLSSSDMDITLDIGDEVMDPTHLLSAVGVALKESKNFMLSEIILQCRVPIVKFERTDNNLTGDIAVGNMLAIRNTYMIKTYTEIDNRVRELGYLVKVMVKECECADASTGSLSSYAYTMMVLYFLQQVEPPVIPVLQEIKRPHDVTEYKVEDWDTYFYDNVERLASFWITENTDSAAKLAVQFFKFYYEEFDFTKHVIAPKQRALLECGDKGWYKSINIEDPFNLDHNLGKHVASKIFEVIKTVFKQAYLRFAVEPERTEITMKYYLDKNYLLDGKAPPRNFICFGCGSRDHYIYDCPQKNSSRWMCTECNETGHLKSECPKIKCFTCHKTGHIGANCPKKRDNKKYSGNQNSPMKYPRSPHKQTTKDKDKNLTKTELPKWDSKNWLGNTLNNVMSDTLNSDKTRKTNSISDKDEHKRTGMRTLSETSVHAEAPRRPKEISAKNKKKKRNSNSESNKDSIFTQDFIPIKPCGVLFYGNSVPAPSSLHRDLSSDPYSNEPHGASSGCIDKGNKKPKPAVNNVLHVKTTSEGKLMVEKPKTDPVKEVTPATQMKLMGNMVKIDVPDKAKETSRQKKSKSMVRKDLFGDNKPRNPGGNKRQNVKVGKVSGLPDKHGSGCRPTKTEMYVPKPTDEPDQCRYGPKREVDDYAADLAPDFHADHTKNIFNPDPDDLSQWGDLTPSMEADPVMGASMHKELGLKSPISQPKSNNWIDYLSSSPEKPKGKPASTIFNNVQQQPPSSGQYNSPPKNAASVQLLNQLHKHGGDPQSSPSRKYESKPANRRKMNNSGNNSPHSTPPPPNEYNSSNEGPKFYRTKARNETFQPATMSPSRNNHYTPPSGPVNRRTPSQSPGPNSFLDPKKDPYLQRPSVNNHAPGYNPYNGPGSGNGPNFEALKRRPNTGRGRAASQWTNEYNRRR